MAAVSSRGASCCWPGRAFTSQDRGILLGVASYHAGALVADEDKDYWVDRTMERFWRAVAGPPPGPLPVAGRRHAVPEVVRQVRPAGRVARGPVAAAETRTDSRRAVAYLSFVKGFNPRDTYQRQPDRWCGVHDVDRLKRILLAWLRRNERIPGARAVSGRVPGSG